MSRHRDVRSMNYSDEYDGYDDVYGHSVEDDYCVSPSVEQFLFDRNKQQNIASFITEPDIVEDNEDTEESVLTVEKKLSELEIAKLQSCMESIKNIIGDTIPESELRNKIIRSNFNTEAALDSALKESSPKSVAGSSMAIKDRTEHYPGAATNKPRTPSFTIPKLSFKRRENLTEDTRSDSSLVNNIESLKHLAGGSWSTSVSPTLSPCSSCSISSTVDAPSASLTEIKGNRVNVVVSSSDAKAAYPDDKSEAESFGSLADLTANYLQRSLHVAQHSNNLMGMNRNISFRVPRFSDRVGVGQAPVNEGRPRHTGTVAATTKIDLIDAKGESEITGERMVNRTPSPDTWLIDLSTALKEAERLTSGSNSAKPHSGKTSSRDVITSLELSNDFTGLPYPRLPTTLNMMDLVYARLPGTKEHVSLFGRTLCRTWKSRKPMVVQPLRWETETIKRFDFSTPYTHT